MAPLIHLRSARHQCCLIAALVAALALYSNALAAESPEAAAASNSASLARERQSLQAVCGSQCHTLDLFASARKSYEDWHDTVQKMVDRGANGTDDQFMDIMDYLFQTQTLIDVNAAAPEDLAIVLQLSPSQAQAIVARRQQKKFSTLADLKSVRGIDAAKIDAKAPFLVFQ